MDKIKRYKDTLKKLGRIKAIIHNQGYVGAGLAVGITVGAKNPDLTYGINLEISEPLDIKALLEGALDGLSSSLKSQEYFIRGEHKKLEALLKELEN